MYMRKSCETDSGTHVDSNPISAAGVPMSGTRVKHDMGTPTAEKARNYQGGEGGGEEKYV